MNSGEHLRLRVARLKNGDEWSQKREGLTILLVRKGGGRCVYASSAQLFSEGDVVVFHNAIAGKVMPANGNEIELSGFWLTLDQLFPLLGPHEIARLPAVSDRLRGIRIYPATGTLASKCQRLLADLPDRYELDHRSQLLRIAASVFAEEFRHVRGGAAGFVRMEDHIAHVFQSLSREDLFTLSVEKLAEKFSCSRRHLNRLFHQYFGTSVATMRMELRLLKAVSLLRDPSIKIIDVAEQSGFNHLGLFNTCFKRRFGVSPGQWRKSNMEPSAEELDPTSSCPLRMRGLCAWEDVLPHGPAAPPACTSARPSAFTGKVGLSPEASMASSGAKGALKLQVQV